MELNERDLDRGEARTFPVGMEVLHDPTFNKGTAFTDEERDALRIRGLLPPRVMTQDAQKLRVLGNFRRKTSDLEKYVFMIALQDRNESLFYRTLVDNIEEMMPILYTPTVGQACKEFGHIFRRPRGLYVAAGDRGRIAGILKNWPVREVGICVVTDGERILGLGDLGANGMGIPIGKLSLYTACAGIDPSLCLPVMLDVGTDNEELLADPLYIGVQRARLRGSEYDDVVEEFVTALEEVFPRTLLQFEDFGSRNAFRLLAKYRDRVSAFNDDIQGTAAVVLAGLLAANRLTGSGLKDQKLLFQGAASAAIGIADLIVFALMKEGLSEAEALERCWFVDSTGLVVKSRERLQEHKRRYAHDHEFLPDLFSAVKALKPTALIGVSGQPQTFTQPVLEMMAQLVARPIVFALSNPTSKSECTAEQAYRWTKGKAVFASGSPFGPVEYAGETFVPGQGNNAYIFPGLGLGVLASGARRVTDDMFFAAAEALSEQVSEDVLRKGLIYPPLAAIREVSAVLAARVAAVARDQNLAAKPLPDDLLSHVKAGMYDPGYRDYAAASS